MIRAILVASICSLLAGQVVAQDGTIGLCTAQGCSYCPANLLQQGTGYPACVIYKRDDVLGSYAKDYKDSENGSDKDIWFNIPKESNPTCRTIIRTPAATDDTNCGYPVYAGDQAVCTSIETRSTLMVQFCCGTGDCTKAGAESRSLEPHEAASLTSALLRDADGNLIIPHAVGRNGVDMMDQFLADMGLNSSSVERSTSAHGAPIFKRRSLETRDCDKYIPDGGTYTTTGSQSYVVSDYICDSTSSVTITNSHSIARTTTFSASVMDPFGIVSASTGFMTTKMTTQQFSYMFTPKADQCGHVVWTPFFLCTKGKITGCKAGTQNGDVCTAKKISDKQIDGVYHFVELN